MEKRFLSVKEVSEFLGISRITINRWVKAGEIPSYKLGKRRVFDKEEVIAWVKSHEDDRKGGE